jgi:hypothetical protein
MQRNQAESVFGIKGLAGYKMNSRETFLNISYCSDIPLSLITWWDILQLSWSLHGLTTLLKQRPNFWNER